MPKQRYGFGVEDIDALLGGGIPSGGVLSMNGEPGSGKSLIAIRFLTEGIVNEQNGLYVSFTTMPLSTTLEEVIKYPSLSPVVSSKKPMFINVTHPSMLQDLVNMIETDGIRRIVLDHPEALQMRDKEGWFKQFEEFLLIIRSTEAGVLVLGYPGTSDDRTPISFLCEGILSLSLGHSLKREACLIKWPYGSDGAENRVSEEEVGEWLK